MITFLVAITAAFLPSGMIAFFLIHVFYGGVTTIKSAAFAATYTGALIVSFGCLMILTAAPEPLGPFWTAVIAGQQGMSATAAIYVYWVSRHPKFDPAFIPGKYQKIIEHETPKAFLNGINRFVEDSMHKGRLAAPSIPISSTPSTRAGYAEETFRTGDIPIQLVTVPASPPAPERPATQASQLRPTGLHRLKRPGE